MTSDAAIGKAAHAALGLACAAIAKVLPWSNRSQHDSYLHGYRDGLRDGSGLGRQEARP